jgi:hypothetical protein
MNSANVQLTSDKRLIGATLENNHEMMYIRIIGGFVHNGGFRIRCGGDLEDGHASIAEEIWIAYRSAVFAG